ncbi:hypothetical protein [Arthrobacter sp. JSM 101049]|uniref:hypothetical protein n=1 Tax=Arthrobacter sp. JSM 101049 TaxID=929097 RepID=UPI003566E5E2
MVDAPRPRRITATAAAALAVGLVLSGCTGSGPAEPTSPSTTAESTPSANPDQVRLTTPKAGVHQLPGRGADLALDASRAFFAHAPAAVVLETGNAKDHDGKQPGGKQADDKKTDDKNGKATPDDGGDAQAAAQRAEDLGIPLLLAPETADQSTAVGAELDRLGATTIIRYGAPQPRNAADGSASPASGSSSGPAWDVEVVDGTDPAAEMPPVQAAAPANDLAAVALTGNDDPGTRAGLATARAAGATVHTMASPDPRAEKDRGFFRKHADSALFALGDGYGPAKEFAALARTAATGPELPGGGQIVFPQRRMVALYGTPGTGSLGVLGEQGIKASITRARKLAARYQPYSKQQVQPAFEIIATVASASAGKDGNYSTYVPVKTIEPWVEAARKAGVYVVLDLQPGRNDFLTQAKHYERLLKYPNVGLAYDPEWRLKPHQRHMAQIGSVSAAELNRTNDWLAQLTRKHRLPQKVVILHQFQLGMIRDRADLDTSHPELALVLHADGNGNPGQKMATWNALRRDLPQGIRMAWKNFIDEDSPTFTPKQTFDVNPKPWFVSYQ